jgi:sec-independent protein translocase protein TatA
MGAIGAPELLIVLLIILLIFGGTKLPKLARSLGEAQREFRQGQDEVTTKSATREVPPAAAPQPAPQNETPPS